MQTKLRPILLLALLTLALGLLPACGGGGGGGTLPDSGGLTPLSGDANIIVFQATDGADQIVFKGVSLSKTADGILAGSGGNKVTLFTGEGGQPSDFSDGTNYIRGEASSPSLRYDVVDGYEISQYTHTIYLGGKKLGPGLALEYADFGIWLMTADAQVYAHDGTFIKKITALSNYFGFYTETSGHGRPPTAGQSFSGRALALAVSRDESEYALLNGVAKLDVTAPSGSLIGTLKLDFARYYSITFGNIMINSAGVILMGPGRYTQVSGENELGYSSLDFNKAGSTTTTLEGAFYGPGSANASEAAGRFWVMDNSANGPLVHGAFGVKEKK